MLYSKIEGKGEPLVILHGFLGMSDNWNTLGGKFAENGFEVHMLDMRNHGRSFHSDEFTYEAMVGDVFEYCVHYNLKNINLLGHSMGGKTAMFFGAAHPEILKSLIVADIGPQAYPPHNEDILAALNAVDFSNKPDRQQIEDMMTPFVPEKSTRQFLMKSLYWKKPEELAFRFNLEAFNKHVENIWIAMPEDTVVNVPTLFLKGSNSNYIRESDIPLLKQMFPNSEIVTIDNAGHWLHAENPTDFYKAVFDFITEDV